PGIEKLLRTDFEIVRFIVQQIERASEGLRYLGMSRVIEDFFRATMSELNFMTEANNCERLRINLARIDEKNDFHVPRIYREFSFPNILVMEYLDGRPFNQFKSLEEL